MLREAGKNNQIDQLKKAQNTIQGIKTLMNLMKESHEPLVNCRTSIESLLNKSHNQTLEPHASGIFQQSDETEEDTESGKWSDEEIIVG